jgi:hypothetical protein
MTAPGQHSRQRLELACVIEIREESIELGRASLREDAVLEQCLDELAIALFGLWRELMPACLEAGGARDRMPLGASPSEEGQLNHEADPYL